MCGRLGQALLLEPWNFSGALLSRRDGWRGNLKSVFGHGGVYLVGPGDNAAFGPAQKSRPRFPGGGLRFSGLRLLLGALQRYFLPFLAAFLGLPAASSSRAACAAANRATGTRNGEQLT